MRAFFIYTTRYNRAAAGLILANLLICFIIMQEDGPIIGFRAG
jgi:hypothetical protein